MEAMETFQDSLPLEIAPGQIRGNRQAVEIIGFERGRLIGARELVVGVTPGATSVALTAVFKLFHPKSIEAGPQAGDVRSLARFGTASNQPSAALEAAAVAHQVEFFAGIQRNRGTRLLARLV